MFTICDVLHEANKQTNEKKREQTLESVQHGLEIIFKHILVLTVLLALKFR